MKHYVYLLVIVLSQLAWGTMYDPPPLNPDPMALGADTVTGADGTASADTAQATTPAAASAEPIIADTSQRFKNKLVAREKTRVAVLGYHKFSETAPIEPMLVRTSEFRKQMQRIRESSASVISMKEFLEWKAGTRLLPEECILITMDDGWRSVYTDAYPILKEYGYPFHLFLYTDYLHGAGSSMAPETIREMMQNGASIGSHSASHYSTKTAWSNAHDGTAEAYETLLEKELKVSMQKLSQLFGNVTTYCYPGGYHEDRMRERLNEFGYAVAFTVLPGKVRCTDDAYRIDRYMILGTDKDIFDSALNFRLEKLIEGPDTGYIPGVPPTNAPRPTFPVSPQPDAEVPRTILTITADLSHVTGLDTSSITMRVSGFGKVNHHYNPTERRVEWTLPCRIYMPLISVHLSWKTTDGATQRAVWSFVFERNITAD